MRNTVVAIYDHYEDANQAFQALLDAGFSRANTQLHSSADDLNPDQASSTARSLKEETGIGHFFRSLFGMEDDREQGDIYAESVRRGSYVLTIQADSEEQADQATTIMNRFDPADIEERSSYWKSQGWTGYDPAAPMLSKEEIEKDRLSYSSASPSAMSATPSGTSQEAKIPVIQEELKVGKRTVQRGGVRIFQNVEETPVNESVTLHEEQVKVERRPVDQAASPADMAAFQEGSIEIPEKAEEAVVSKSARVVEEVVVSKESRDRTETISDTVRSTNVEVEPMENVASPVSATPGSTVADGIADQDEQDFRTHWQTSYGSQGGRYEDYDDAYRYGSSISGNDRYKNRQWLDMESDLRSDWEATHPGSAWEKVKDAVRYGAESLSGKNRH